MPKYSVALFIGRFQPFHNGHLYSLKKCLELAESVVIAVGSSQESSTENNPWDYRLRKQMVCEVVRAEGVESRVEKICSCPDNPSDQQWLRQIVKRAGRFDVVVSNNDWVLSIFREAGYVVFESGLHNRDELEGVKIRALMRVGDEGWKQRVPSGIIQLISKSVDQIVG